MSQASASLNNAPPPGSPGSPGGEPSARAQRKARPKSWIAQAALDALGRWSAVLGLVWVGTLAFLAVFAPLLASSFPIAMADAQGDVTLPILRSLNWVDITLLVALVVAGLVWLPGVSRRLAGKRGWVLLGAVVVAAGVSGATVDPPENVVLSQYREGLADGSIRWAWFTLVPYSATDAMRESPIDARLREPGWFPTDAMVAQAVVNQAEQLSASELPIGTPEQKQTAEAWAAAVNEGESLPQGIAAAPEALRELDATPRHTSFHAFGTDATGYDLLSRMIHACRIALAIGFIATGIAVVIGCIVGGLMGYFSGWVDLFGMRLVEVFAAIPTIFLLIAITAFYGRNLYLMMVIIGLTGWVGYALFVRAEFLKLRKQDYVQAAIACGVPLPRVLLRHMLPNGVAPVLVNASFGVAGAILTESTLSFLGLGLVEEPSWGQMLNQARGVGGALNWWIAVFPGVAIFFTVFAYNLVGEALRDALDPKAKK